MSEWVKCIGANNSVIYVNLAAVLTMTEYGSGTRLALLGSSQTYLDVLESPTDMLTLPRIVNNSTSSLRGHNTRREEGLFEAPM